MPLRKRSLPSIDAGAKGRWKMRGARSIPAVLRPVVSGLCVLLMLLFPGGAILFGQDVAQYPSLPPYQGAQGYPGAPPYGYQGAPGYGQQGAPGYQGAPPYGYQGAPGYEYRGAPAYQGAPPAQQ